MSQERRTAPRARVPGSFVHCEGAAGERIQADVVNMSTGGLFIRTAKPLAVGKRLSLKIQVGGVSAPWWFAFARVIWVRASGTGETPAGMGVKLLDVEDDAATETIARLVDERLRAQPQVELPVRERTVLGVGAPTAPAPWTPEGVSVAPPTDADWERPTVVGEPTAVGAEAAPPMDVAAAPVVPQDSEPLPFELRAPSAGHVRVEEAAAPPMTGAGAVLLEAMALAEPEASSLSDAVPGDPPDSDSSLVAAGVPRRRGGGWLVLLLLASVAGGGYVLRDRWLPRARAMLAELTGAASPPSPSPPVAPPAVAAGSATASGPRPIPSVSSMASASPLLSASVPSASAPRGPSASPTPGKQSVRPVVASPPPQAPPPTAPVGKPPEDNPY